MRSVLMMALAAAVLTGCNAIRGSARLTAANSPPMTVAVTIGYEGGGSTQMPMGTCTVPAGSDIGTITDCTIEIPEGLLFYGDMKINVGVIESACAMVDFRPYYYVLSTAAAFTPAWGDSAVDCSDPDTLECYNGPAKLIVPSFPDNIGIYFASNYLAASAEYDVPSANSQSPSQSNRWAANNLQAASRTGALAMAVGDEYVANSFQDYTFDCVDEYLRLNYRIIMTIADQDDVSTNFGVFPTVNQRDDWKRF